jgi:hypothetical protein
MCGGQVLSGEQVDEVDVVTSVKEMLVGGGALLV